MGAGVRQIAEQRHSRESRESREAREARMKRERRRRDPRVKVYGFTRRQWQFLYILVGNWLFSLVFFIAAKLMWQWSPAEWSTPGDKLALVMKCAGFAILPGILGICIVAAQRLNPNLMVGRMAKPNSSLDINTRFILNTFEQFTGFFIAISLVALYSPQADAKALPILTALFLIGRLLFWYGYHKNPYLRAFGFGLTFYPSVAVYIWYVFFMLIGLRIPLF
jgi:uncharacterized membrane protein YecN with MAPEG domain